jgi:hypothetical protein
MESGQFCTFARSVSSPLPTESVSSPKNVLWHDIPIKKCSNCHRLIITGRIFHTIDNETILLCKHCVTIFENLKAKSPLSFSQQL